MAIAFVASVSAVSTDSNTFTSGAIDTTGASLLVVMVTYYEAIGAPTLSDSKGNTWTALTARIGSASGSGKLFYAANPTVGSGHTFTATGAGFYGSLAALAFSGALTASPFDSENGGNESGPAESKACGSVTPSEDNEVIVAGLVLPSSATSNWAIDEGMTLQENAVDGGGNSYRVVAAYKIQTSLAAISPTWTWTTSRVATSAIACFKAAAAGGFSSAFFRENAGVGAAGGGPFARANAGLGAIA